MQADAWQGRREGARRSPCPDRGHRQRRLRPSGAWDPPEGRSASARGLLELGLGAELAGSRAPSARAGGGSPAGAGSGGSGPLTRRSGPIGSASKRATVPSRNVSRRVEATIATSAMRRLPSAKRSICTITWIAELIWSRSASNGMWRSLIVASVSRRWIASSGELACTVTSEPSWPVLSAWSMSSVSAPRTSPTMMRSGRMRSELRTRSRIETSPLPSTLDGRASSVTTCGCWRRSSALSSTVMMRSPARHRGRQRVEQRRLAGAGAARDDDVELALDERAQQLRRSARRSSSSRSAGRA